MKKYIGAVALLFVVALGVTWVAEAQQSNSKAGFPLSNKEADTDITKTVREYNSDKYADPPTTFRRGHVKPRKLATGALRRTATGFVVQMPSKAPVATPAVYDGKVYVGGGFRSKEFYCLDAKTGKLVWGLNLDDDGPSSAAVTDGVVVYNTESCTIFAHDAGGGGGANRETPLVALVG